jgi:putative PIN family toxin of toxin-antitoxin system
MNIVLDTNVLIAAAKSKQGASFQIIKRVLEDARIRLHISTPLVLEYEEILLRIAPMNQKEVEIFLSTLLHNAQEHEIYFLFRGVLPDDDDAMVLELAMKAHAQIITFNIKDFQQAREYGISVVTPQEFLTTLQVTKRD